jgi:hypothetical protein
MLVVVLIAGLTVTAGTTLGGLTNGLHNVAVYAKDTFGNTGGSETVDFTVDAPFPITWLIVAILLSIAGGVFFAIYWFTKRRSRTSNTY